MKRLLIFIVVFSVLLTVPLTYFVLRTYHGLAQEEEGALRYFAESLFGQMEEDLARLVAQEEARGVFEYSASGQVSAPADNGAARFPFVIGYLQNRPDGALDMPAGLNSLLGGAGKTDKERIEAANAAFNRRRAQEVEIAATRQVAPAPASVPAPKKEMEKAQPPSIAEQYVKQAPSKGKWDSLGKKSARYEEITETQARELASAGQEHSLTDGFSSLFSRGGENRSAKNEKPAPSVNKQDAATVAAKEPPAAPALAEQRYVAQAPEEQKAAAEVGAVAEKQADESSVTEYRAMESPAPQTEEAMVMAAAPRKLSAPAEADKVYAKAESAGTIALPAKPSAKDKARKSDEKTRKVFVEVAPLQSLFLSDDTVFVFRRIMVGNETFRQGFVIDIPALLNYFCRTLFEGQPMAGFAGLTLHAADNGRELSRCRSGHAAQGNAFLLSRSFPRPFSFLSGAIASDSIPAIQSRSRLDTMIAILILVLGAGFFALFWSARSAWEYSERRSAFVSSVTHELKTPLTNIRLYIEMLESGMAIDREQEEEYLRILSSESGRLSRLIENVLEFSRLERKRRVMNMAEGDLSEVLAAVKDTHGPRLAKEGFTLSIRQEGIKPFLYDREAMVQVLCNLVENARKFSGKSPEKQIEIAMAQDEKETRISVSDKGPGIPRKALSKVFQDFYRVEGASGPLVGGTGIGLALTRKLVSAMGGQVLARNNDGPGLTVTIRIPRK